MSHRNFISRIEECSMLNEILKAIAHKYLLVKFVYIIASKCTEGFPDFNCPGILLYRNGGLAMQFIPALKSLGGKTMCFECNDVIQL